VQGPAAPAATKGQPGCQIFKDQYGASDSVGFQDQGAYHDGSESWYDRP
jgi:hypothetical protein